MNHVNVLFFGPLIDIAGKEKMSLEAKSVNDAKVQLERNFPELIGRTYRFALNQEIIYGDFPLKNGDELALLPPFAGG
jgi:molybdopterin synthase sulfur carrier subunit